MSLINDALKRAKQAQQQAATPTSPEPHLRPVEPVAHAKHGVEFLVPTALTLVALLVLLLVWRWAHQRGPVEGVRAKSGAPSEQTSVAPVASAVELSKSPLQANGNSVVPPASTAANELPANPRLVQSPPAGEAIPPAQVSNSELAATQIVAAAAPEPPKPAPLKLQGIVFSPTRPSAVINGKSLFLGDRVREFKLIAIRRESVTLASPGQTNVLSLSD
jgi:hypothetical protein